MPDHSKTPESPHSEISYAGFPVSGANGNGLWCPVCGLGLEAVVHRPGIGVGGLHRLWRVPDGYTVAILDTWWCTIQGVG